MSDMFEAIAKAEADALAQHERGECHLSEWSCSHCERAEADHPDTEQPTRVTPPGAIRLGSCCINVGTDECACENPTNYGLDTRVTPPAQGAKEDS